MRLRFLVLWAAMALGVAACGGSAPPAGEKAASGAPADEPGRALAGPDLTAYPNAPEPKGEQLRRLADLQRDIAALTHEGSAVRDLADDLGTLSSADRPPAETVRLAFAERIRAALDGSAPDEKATERLAQLLWVVMHSGRLEPEGLATLEKEFQAALKAAGAQDAGAQAAALEIRALASELKAAH